MDAVRVVEALAQQVVPPEPFKGAASPEFFEGEFGLIAAFRQVPCTSRSYFSARSSAARRLSRVPYCGMLGATPTRHMENRDGSW